MNLTEFLIDALSFVSFGGLIVGYGWLMYQVGKSDGELKVYMANLKALIAKTKQDTARLESSER